MFSPEIIEAARQHAMYDFPREACGIVVSGAYIPCVNVADEGDEFHIPPAAYVDELIGGTLEAVIHSHTNGQAFPSTRDQAQQMAMQIPWGIVVLNENGEYQETFFYGDQLKPQPLIERPFRWFVQDCYSLVRDWYRMHRGITLPNFVRRHNWVEQGQNLFMQYFKEAGFSEIAQVSEPGDVVLVRTSSSTTVPNLCGVYIGNGEVLYQPSNGLSRKKLMAPEARYITHHMRFTG